jgi:hypothetical protein
VKTLFHRTLAVLTSTIVAASALVGCAGEADAPKTGDDDMVAVPNSITLQNWSNHPSIVEIRAITVEIDGDIKAGKMVQKERDNLCDSIGDTARELYTDAASRGRKLVMSHGSEHSAGATTVYYDANGTLRFIYDELTGDWGRAWDYRAYFDAAGNTIWEVTRNANEGGDWSAPTPDLNKKDANGRPVYPFELPNEESIKPSPDRLRDPVAAFAAEPECD